MQVALVVLVVVADLGLVAALTSPRGRPVAGSGLLVAALYALMQLTVVTLFGLFDNLPMTLYEPTETGEYRQTAVYGFWASCWPYGALAWLLVFPAAWLVGLRTGWSKTFLLQTCGLLTGFLWLSCIPMD